MILATRFLQKLSDGKKVLSPAAYAVLASHDWPGNARELRNTIERASLFAQSDVLQPEHLFPERELESVASFHHAKEQIIGSFERQYVEALLIAASGKVSHAAKLAGMSRASFYELLARTGLKRARL